MSNYCKNCYELTEELENHKRWIKDYKQKLEDAEEIANAKITQCGNLIKQLNETFEQLEAYKMEAEEGKEINAELKAENEELKRLIAKQKNAKIQLSKLKDKQYKEFCDMKQTLTEIKEIAEDFGFNGTYESYKTAIDQILQKISECEVEDDNT